MKGSVTYSYGVSITFEPWFGTSTRNFSLSYLHLYEEIGGLVANGEIQLMYISGDQKASDLIQNESTGTIVITDESGGTIRTIPVYIVEKNFSVEHNFLTMKFVCISDIDFINIKRNTNYSGDLKGVIESLYPGQCDFREVESDIQDKELVFYQNNETDLEFLTRLAYSYKYQSIFSFGWEGFMLKETYGKKNSFGKEDPGDPPLCLRLTGTDELLDDDTKTYDINLSTFPYNPWEDTSGEKEISDYTEFEPINLRALKKYDEKIFVQTKYLQMLENLRYNKIYQDSDFFINFRLKLYNIPTCKIGDVIIYENSKNFYAKDPIKLPYKYFLVRSNEFFIATEKSTVRDAFGGMFSWVMKLSGIETSNSISLGDDENPGGTVI